MSNIDDRVSKLEISVAGIHSDVGSIMGKVDDIGILLRESTKTTPIIPLVLSTIAVIAFLGGIGMLVVSPITKDVDRNTAHLWEIHGE